ncbi:MAG: DNA polymerase III subunit gamma and tau [Propionibacteriaceae bacterium]
MSDNLFDDELDLFGASDGYEQDGPSLFGDEPIIQDGPALFEELPEPDSEITELAAPAAPVRTRMVDTAPAAPLALYRRYRPDSFADVIGQEHVTDPLQRALVNNRVNHAYLFSGPRGCGKTTSARILARCLNCEQGPTPTPCGECQSCRDLARGGNGSIDVIEIDAASHGGVDDARDLRERAFFAPVHSRYKIYIIDEAHMVTSAGFNALLKLVEEPPPHVKFIFATTEPEKVIGTIRSRTHHYPFRLVPPKVLTSYLSTLCDKEGVVVDPAVMPLVVRAGAGSVRDSLSVLDQLLGGAQADGVSYEHASTLLGYTPDSLLDRIVDAFGAGDSSEVFATIDAVVEQGQDPRRFAEDLLRRLRDLVVVAAVDDAITSGLIDVSGDQAERLSHQAAAMGLGELTRAAEVISTGLTQMRGTTAPRLHLELMCARVLLPGADVDERGIHARLDRLERRFGMGDPTTPPPTSVVAVDVAKEKPTVGSSSQGPEILAPEVAQPKPVVANLVQDKPVMAEPVATEPARSESVVPEFEQIQEAPQVVAAEARLTIAFVRQQWPQILEQVKERRRFTWIMLSQNAHVMDVQGDLLTLGMANVGARDSWERGGNAEVLTEVIAKIMGHRLRIEAIVDGAASPRHAPEPESEPSIPTEPKSAVSAQIQQVARENIRPTRMVPAETEPASEEDESQFSRDDESIDVNVSSDALLRDVLGAQRIDEQQL